MKRLIIPLVAAAGILYIGTNFKQGGCPENESIANTVVYAQESSPLSPEIDYSKTINNRPVHFYNFDLKDIELGILLEERPKLAGYYMDHLLNQYGDSLEFIAAAGFYCMHNNNSIGRIYHGGEIRARGMYEGGACIVYRDHTTNIVIEPPESVCREAEWSHGGFGRLLMDRELDFEETKKRGLDYWAKKPRTAFVLYSESRAGFAFYTGSLGSLAHGLKALGVQDAVLPDSGNSRFFACRKNGEFEILKRDNKHRKIKSVIYGVSSTRP